MINLTKDVVIDEEVIFEDLKECFFEIEVFDDLERYIDTMENLPKDTQRAIFAKIGDMMINFAKSENF